MTDDITKPPRMNRQPMTDDMRETLDAIEGLAHTMKFDLRFLYFPDWIKFNEHLHELKRWVSAVDDYKGCRHGAE